MPIYIVSYDLLKQKDYGTLINALQKAGAKKILYSQWLLRDNRTAVEVKDVIKIYIDSDDRLFVDELSERNWAGRNLLIDPKDF